MVMVTETMIEGGGDCSTNSCNYELWHEPNSPKRHEDNQSGPGRNAGSISKKHGMCDSPTVMVFLMLAFRLTIWMGNGVGEA